MAVLGSKIREEVVRCCVDPQRNPVPEMTYNVFSGTLNPTHFTSLPNEIILTFGGCYLCATFGENRSRNATVRVWTDR